MAFFLNTQKYSTNRLAVITADRLLVQVYDEIHDGARGSVFESAPIRRGYGMERGRQQPKAFVNEQRYAGPMTALR